MYLVLRIKITYAYIKFFQKNESHDHKLDKSLLDRATREHLRAFCDI